MLKEWQLANFKAISEKTKLDVAPLTILVGENSSGKSTILQSILLLAQTLRATSSRQPLVLNGEYIRLGYMSDVVHDGWEHLPLEIGFVLHSDDEHRKLQAIDVRFGVHARAQDFDSREGILSYLMMKCGNDNISLERTFPKGNTLIDEDEYNSLRIPLNTLSDISTGLFDNTVKNIDISRGNLPSHIDIYDLHSSLYHFLPNQILESYNALRYSMIQALKIAGDFLRLKETRTQLLSDIITVPPINLNNLKESNGALMRRELETALVFNIPSLKSYDSNYEGSAQKYASLAKNFLAKGLTLEEWLLQIKKDVPHLHARTIGERLQFRATYLERLPEDEGTFISGIGVRAVDLPFSLQEVKSEIINYFSQRVYYLGPLREDPQFIYSLPPFPELTHVGLKGEFTASVLERFKNNIIEYPIPPKIGSSYMEIGRDTLAVALEKWLVHMGLLQSANTEDKGKMGTELTVNSPGVQRKLDLTSVGVGVSQILPTLVMGLIAPAGTTFLLEQPELHLHPKVQSIVADFLLGLTKVGKQCIVETHSEYLVTRLRLRVAEDQTNTLSSKASIYFVERFNGKSSFRKLDLNQYGAFFEWPEGFMDQGPNESELIMKAALKKRKQQQAAD
jgi:predicted ATPase